MLLSLYLEFLAYSPMQPDYLGPHLHGIIASFNIVLVRLDYFEDSEKGKQVSKVNVSVLLQPAKYIIMCIYRRHCTSTLAHWRMNHIAHAARLS